MQNDTGMPMHAKLKRARTAKVMSFRDLSAATGIEEHLLRHYEAGAMAPSMSDLDAIAKALDVPAHWFLEINPETGKPAPRHEIELYVGCVQTDEGCYHSVQAVDPLANADDGGMAALLAGRLHSDPEDPRFKCFALNVEIPESVIRRILESGN